MRARITVTIPGSGSHSEVVEGTRVEIERKVQAIAKRYRNCTVSWREEEASNAE